MSDNNQMSFALSFDIEEFDVPMDYGVKISFDRQIEISSQGLERILDMLHNQQVRVTFFCTAAYAHARPELIRRMIAEGHEVASHSFNHSRFVDGDLQRSREALEALTEMPIRGYRSPRMGKRPDQEIKNAGYRWDSSLNPCFLPGRYNNFHSPRRPYVEACGLIQIPASVATPIRVPLFWLALHNFPLGVYKWLCHRSMVETGLLNIYFHPWEFSDALFDPQFKIPGIMRRNSGLLLVERLSSVIAHFKKRGASFVTLSEVAQKLL